MNLITGLMRFRVSGSLAGLPTVAVALCLCLTQAAVVQAADYSEDAVEWEFRAGLDKLGFRKAFEELGEKSYRIADLETYRSGRSPVVSTVWTRLKEGERWVVEMSMPFTEFAKALEAHGEKGFSLVELEVDRNGATLHFSGVWLKGEKPIDTKVFFAMNELEFSNRYGEMADSGYRLIDYQAYQSNGKNRNAGIWLKDDHKHEVRFYRGIAKPEFLNLADNMHASGFRLLDVEGYESEEGLAMAGEWVRLAPGDKTEFAIDLTADEFFSRNAAHVANGYRLTEFEVFEDRSALRYAGSWFKPGKKGSVQEEKPASGKLPSLEEFRNP